MENKLPKGWQVVKLGDVVEHVKDKIPNREEWNFDRYIGGEHFEEGEIRITRSAPIEGNEEVIGSAFHIRFKPGQVLYVTRNPRLRKGGIVDFEGVCSNVTFTLESKDGKLLQKLLPFIIQTESFTKHACNSAHGSTNPFLNWKDIASYDLLLPPINEQNKIAEVLWSIEKAIMDEEVMSKSLSKFKELITDQLLLNGLTHSNFKKTPIGPIPDSWEFIKIGEAININPDGMTYKKGDTIKYIDISTITETGLIGEPTLYEFSEAPSRARRSIQKEDVLISMVRPYLKAFAKVNLDDKNLVCSTGFAVLRETNRILSDYIYQFVLSNIFMNQVEVSMVGSNYPAINQGDFNKFIIPLPPIDEQKKIINVLNKIELVSRQHKNNLYSLKALRQKLMNELLLGKTRLE